MRDVLKNACGLPVDTKVMQINFRGAYVHLFPLAASSGHPRRRVASFTGYMQHCDGYRSLEYMLNDFVLIKP